MRSGERGLIGHIVDQVVQAQIGADELTCLIRQDAALMLSGLAQRKDPARSRVLSR